MPSRRLLLLLFLCGATSWSADLRAADPPADPHGIDRLIRQLDSDDFEQREAASRALVRIGGPALDALKQAAGPPSSPEVRWRAAALVEHIENSLDQLLADYRRFGLPLPPEDAPLVRFEERPSYMLESGDDRGHLETTTIPPTYSLGFLVEPATWTRPAKLLYATETLEREAIQVGPPLAPQQLTVDYLKANHSGPSESLALALQMHARGWSAAATVFDKLAAESSEHSRRTELHLRAWEYWDGRLQDAADDSWSAAAPQIKTLMASDPDLDTPENRALLKSLQAALTPSHAKPGSVEALIDDLIHADGTGLADNPFRGRADERFKRVFDLGFEAVPALLEHLDDDRLTRYLDRPDSFSGIRRRDPPYHYRVGDMASDLLEAIAGRQAARRWQGGREDRTAEKRSALEWWDKARKQGEEAYLVANVLPPASKDQSNAIQRLDTGLIRLLSNKYPRRLADIYRNVVENRQDIQSYDLVEALAASSLPREDKIELFALAAAGKSLKHRCTALCKLKDLDAKRFVSLLTATLDDLPRTPTEPYSSFDEVWFTPLVCSTDDAGAWQALNRAARRADTGLRMEMLCDTDYPLPTAPQLRLRLAFLAGFLDDAAVQDVDSDKEKFCPSYAGQRFRRLEVRNYAAMRISELLKTPDSPATDWTPEQWAELREQMRVLAQRRIGEGTD